MQIEYGINPNCSEATLRIALKGQKRADIDALMAKLEIEFNHDWSGLESKKTGEWDDDKIKQEYEFEWSEAYSEEKTIFGIPVLEIRGDAPYNFGEEILAVVHKYLPKAKYEWNEP